MKTGKFVHPDFHNGLLSRPGLPHLTSEKYKGAIPSKKPPFTIRFKESEA